MTLVEVLCLNHRIAYEIVHAAYVDGPRKFDVCMSAGHRMFHFYEGLHDPTPYAWIYPMNDFENIENGIRIGKYCSNEYALNLDRFIESWRDIVSKGFTPEWFLYLPEQLFGTDPLQVNIAPQKRFLIEIMDTLGTGSMTSHKETGEKLEKEQDSARERKQAYFDMQKVDRKAEEDFLMYLRKWQQSKSTEQRWLGVMAMTHYLRGGLADFDGFCSWLCKNLIDTSFLIRAETLDMLQSLVITNPTLSLNLIERLNNSKRFALQIAAFDLARRIISVDFYYGQRYHEQLIKHHRPIDEEYLPRFGQLCEHSSKNLIGWFDQLMKMKSYRHLDEMCEKELRVLKKGIEEYSLNGFEQYIGRMSRLLARYRLTKKHFEIES